MLVTLLLLSLGCHLEKSRQCADAGGCSTVTIFLKGPEVVRCGALWKVHAGQRRKRAAPKSRLELARSEMLLAFVVPLHTTGVPFWLFLEHTRLHWVARTTKRASQFAGSEKAPTEYFNMSSWH